MLTQLLVFGLFATGSSGGGAETGLVVATGQRTAVLVAVAANAVSAPGVPWGAVAWQQQFDPADHTPYAIDFGALLEAGEKIVDIEAIAMTSTAALLGVGIDDAEDYAPIIDEGGKKLQIWFVVDEDAWATASFNAGGVSLPVTVRIVTDSAPPKRYERTTLLTVRQL